MVRNARRIVIHALAFHAAVLGWLGQAAPVQAHYPWFTIDPKDGKNGRVNFYFEEGPRPGDGQYLDPFLDRAKYWIRTGKGEASPFRFEEIKRKGNRWLSASLTAPRPRGIDCYVRWGVYKGQLLHYYARILDGASLDELSGIARAEQMEFDLVPRVKGKVVEVQALWKGKGKSGLKVIVGGPGYFATPTTDAKGLIRFDLGKTGVYRLRTQFIEPETSGKENGVPFRGVRRTVTSTLLLPHPNVEK